jgi:acyl-coenzyme A synthetase/AMP-(fatty) acid ligase
VTEVSEPILELQVCPDKSSVIFTSSGTTGRPKGILQSFPFLLKNTQATIWDVLNQTGPSIISAIPPILRLLAEDPRKNAIPEGLKYFVSSASHLRKKNTCHL